MKNLIETRNATEQDLPFLRKVYGSTRWEELDQAGWGPDEKNIFLDMQFKVQDTQWKINYPKASFRIVLVDQKPAGRLYIDRRKHEIRVVDIALLPEYRGQGIGHRLMSNILEEATRTNRRVGIHVEHQNPAMRLYERLGFKRGKDTGVYYFMEWKPTEEACTAS